MPPRPAARCCGAVHRRLATAAPPAAASPDSVWITDSILATAFARYCRVSPYAYHARPLMGRRFASNVPGPLEARRRLGKRKMTEQLSMQLSLSGGGGGMPPPWALADAPDLRQWNWTPPRDAALITKQNSRDAALFWNKSDSSRDTTLYTQRTGSDAATTTSSLVPKWLIELADLVDPKGKAVELPETTRSATAAPFFTKVEVWTAKYHQHQQNAMAGQGQGHGDDEAAMWLEFDGICREFQTLLRLAGLIVDEVHEAFDLLWGSLEEEASNGGMNAPERVDRAATLLSAVVDGVGACHLLQATDYGLDFWRSLFACVAQLPERHVKTGVVAAQVLSATPATFLAQMTDILPSHLCAIYLSLSVEDGGQQTTREQAREKTIADALGHLDLGGDDQAGHHQKGKAGLVQATTDRLLRRCKNHAATAASFYTSTTSWLFTLAHIPQVRQERFFQTLSQIDAARQQQQEDFAEAHPLSTADLCALLLAQWTSRGYVTPMTELQFHHLLARVRRNNADSKDSDSPMLAVLALAIFRADLSHSYCTALYLSLWGCLQMLGRSDELMASMGALVAGLERRDQQQQQQQQQNAATLESDLLKPLPLPPLAFFLSLAWATDDLRVALQMHSLYNNASKIIVHTPSHQFRPFAAYTEAPPLLWSIWFWDKFAKRLADALEQGVLTPGQVSYALDMHARLIAHKQGKQVRLPKSKKARYGQFASEKKGLGAPTVALVEKLAVHYALAPIEPRCALRGVEECRSLMITHGVEQPRREGEPSEQGEIVPFTASPMVLRALFHTVTRDLDSAQPGRTSRLRWFVDIVRREHGEREAVASGHALERWRSDAALYRKLSAEDERRAIARALQSR